MTPTNVNTEGESEPERLDFLRTLVKEDVAAGKNGGRVHTRFPPEPNGYLHIGHAKAICINYSIAEEHGGLYNLRFDDTNPSKEEEEYVHSIQEDIRWLGFDWEDRLYFASDYFEQLYDFAVTLIEKGKAYVDDQTLDEMRAGRGVGGTPGTDSPFRGRSVQENLDLFARMRAGEFEDGARVLRAKIDMQSAHLIMRDPVMYRIMKTPHHRTGSEWCIYPLYDWAHGQSDAIEGITHSLCSLEFENHRPLYDWFLEQLELPQRPRQIEFARLNLTYAVMSKRKLLRLVENGDVSGWDDPRMLTLSGMRRRGYTPESVRSFCERIGVAKFNSTVDMVQLENALRDDLNERAQRRMGVLRPLRLILENYPEGQEEEVDAVNNPQDESQGKRPVPFSGELFIERDDFRVDAPRKFHRLAPGKEVRLKYAYYATCTGFDTDPDTGEVTAVRATYDPATRGGDSPDGRKVRGTIHWVSARHALDAEVRLYDHLFAKADPEDVSEVADGLEGEADYRVNLNPSSLEVVGAAKLEPSLENAAPEGTFQLERLGYFCVDSVDSSPGSPVLNRAVALRDSWAKIEKKMAAEKA